MVQNQQQNRLVFMYIYGCVLWSVVSQKKKKKIFAICYPDEHKIFANKIKHSRRYYRTCKNFWFNNQVSWLVGSENKFKKNTEFMFEYSVWLELKVQLKDCMMFIGGGSLFLMSVEIKVVFWNSFSEIIWQLR